MHQSQTSDLLSETVKRNVTGAAFDPNSETLFAITHQSSDGRSNVLHYIPVGATEEAVAASTKLEQLKSQEHSTHKLRSLASIKSERYEVESQAWPSGQSQYLPPQFLAEIQGGQHLYATDTFNEPDCLRFCPANSSDKLDISLSGFTVVAKAQGQTARTNKALNEGVHYWEIICPVSCSTLQIGVSNKNQKEEAVQSFRTSTPRVIGIELNLDKLTLNFWLNGRHARERVKKLAPNQHWYPIVKFKEPDYFVILNPFAQGRGTQIDDLNNNYLPQVSITSSDYLFQTLRTSEIQVFNAYLTSKLRGILLVYGVNQVIEENEDGLKEAIIQQIKLDTQPKIEYEIFMIRDEVLNLVTAVIIKFSSYQDSVKYYLANKDLKMLYDKQIATLTQMRNSKEKIGDISLELGMQVFNVLTTTSVLALDDQTREAFMLNSGFSANLTVAQLGKKITQVKEALDQEEVKDYRHVSHQNEVDSTTIEYLESSDKLLLVNGSQIKLITRESGSFNLAGNSHFTMYPQQPEDVVKVKLNRSDSKFLISHIDWSQVKTESFDILSQFLDHVQHQSSQDSLYLPYSEVLASVKALLNVAISQYEHVENFFATLQEDEILSSAVSQQKVAKPAKEYTNNEIDLPFTYGELSLIDVHQLLSILLTIEDQLWAMTQSDQVASSVKLLWSSQGSSSRIHTAYGRLASLITYPLYSNNDPLLLADLGLISTQDMYGKLQHFQEFSVELESIFAKSIQTADNDISSKQESSQSDLRNSLERQFPHNFLLKGFPTWNVKLEITLNNMPPQSHSNGLKREKRNHHKIDYVKTANGSDYVMTAGKDGSINIWNSKLKLNQVAVHNFKSKLHHDDDIITQKPQVNDEEEKKAPLQMIIPKKSKPAIYPELNNKTVTVGDDILFTMFDEQEDAEGIEDQDELQDSLPYDIEASQTLVDYLFDYSDVQAKASTQPDIKQAPSKVVEEVKEELKEEIKEPIDDKPVEPNADFLNQLILMGFNVEFSKKALLQTKNESLSAAIDAIMEIQKSQVIPVKKIPEQTVKIISYECEVCTLINGEGKAQCDACGTPAPLSAFIDTKAEDKIKIQQDETEKIKKEEEEKIMKAKEEEQLKLEAEERQREVEREAQKLRDELITKTQKYYERIQVQDYIFASVKNGADSKPLIAGVIFQNESEGQIDLELQRFGYLPSYLRQFIRNQKLYYKVGDVPFKNYDEALAYLFKNYSTLVESYYPTFIGSQMNSKWSLKFNRHNFQTMSNETIAKLSFKIDTLDSICQIGSNLDSENSIFIMAVGKRQGQSVVIVQRIDYIQKTGDIQIVTISDNSQVLVQAGVSEQVDKVSYDQKSDKIVMVLQSGRVLLLDIDKNEQNLHFKKLDELTLQQDEHVINVQNGYLFINSRDQKIRRYIIDEKTFKVQKQREDFLKYHKKAGQNDSLTENEILKMQIQPENVTVQDIRRYEKLMNGKQVKGKSNAQVLFNDSQSEVSGTNFTKHHWILDKNNEQSNLEIEFEHPTSLISLNIDLTFDCNSIKSLIDKMSSQVSPAIQSENQIVQQKPQLYQEDKHQLNSISNLGLLNIHGYQNEIGTHKEAVLSGDAASQVNTYLPLIVNHHKGASYNQSYQVCRIVADNSLIFASNYPKPEFFFKHLHGHKMNIDKFTLRSNTNSKCGAYPIGSAIIFAADNLSAFELTTPFHKFSLQEYNDWKQERLKDPSAFKQYEPVAYIELDDQTSMTVDIDFSRPCKYIMLKPTAFRKKPTQFTQNINNVPMEIEFFGATGNTFEDSDSCSPDSENQLQDLTSIIGGILSEYELDIRILNDLKVLKTLPNIEITSFQGLNMTINGKSILKITDVDAKAKFTGKATLKISESNLQLQDLRGLAIQLRRQTQESNWTLRGVTLQGIVADEEKSQSSNQNKALFNEPRISTTYMRSCLLSPKFFNVVNKVLAQSLSLESQNTQLRMTIIHFLNKIMRLDKEFIPLILNEIHLKDFLKLSLFSNDNSGTQLVIEFLQNFQRDPQFCLQIYKIIIQNIEQLPQNFMHYNGYESLLGLVKWAIPIDPQQTLQALLHTLYNKICLQKIDQLQSKEQITFRTRLNFSAFPFDQMPFRNTNKSISASQRKESLDIQTQQQSVAYESLNRSILPVDEIRKSTKYDKYHIYQVKFDQEVLVTDIKLFLAQLEQIQYKMIIKIFDSEDKVIYFESFDEQLFAQFASMVYQANSTNSQDDGLHLVNLNLRLKEFKLIIEFSQSYSSLPKSGVKTKLPDSLIEVYGQTPDMVINPKSIKEKIDKKAQEFWTSGANVFKVGSSMQMLRINKLGDETLIVPQVSGAQSYVPPQINEIETSDSKQANLQISHLAASRYSELQTLQEELKGKIIAKDANIKEVVDKIQQLQNELQGIEDGKENFEKSIPSLEYFMTISCDFAKLIRQLSKNSNISSDKVNYMLRALDEDGNLGIVCFEMFKRYIIFDSGTVKSDILAFITNILYPSMSLSEIRFFSFKVIEEFLSTSQPAFSQKSVLESLNSLGIPEGELISFLIHKLGIGELENQRAQVTSNESPLHPFVLMSSVLILTLTQLKKATTTSLLVSNQEKDTQEESKMNGHTGTVKLIISEQKGNQEDFESKDDQYEDLAPLTILRSQSTPTQINGKKSIKQQSTDQNKSYTYKNISRDLQFIILFHTCNWISSDSLKQFSREEKIVLLNLTIENMLQLIKFTDFKQIQDVINNKDAFFQILVTILQLKSKDLTNLFFALFNALLKPTHLVIQADLNDQQNAESKKAIRKDMIEKVISHIQGFLKWIIDIGVKPDIAKLQTQPGQESWTLLLQSYSNQKVWMEQLSFIVELFIIATDELKEITKTAASLDQKDGQLEKIPEENDDADDEDLLPLSVSRSMSLPLKKDITSYQAQLGIHEVSLQIIKSLVQLLYLNDTHISTGSPLKGQKQSQTFFKETESHIKYLSQIWSLVLKSLTAVSINSLIDAKIFDSLVNAFLISTEEIKQITFPQILGITETIAQQSVHTNDISKFISNLLFITLENVTDNHHEKVGYSICQGWLDILISSSVARPQNYETNKQVFAKMSSEELSIFFKKSSLYIDQYLNKGSFEGVTGANTLIVMRLNIASDLIYTIRYAESKRKAGTLALQELFGSVSTNTKIKKEFSDSMNHMLVWLFLNSRQANDELALSQLGNSSNLTPATAKVKQMTEHIEEIFALLGECGDECEEAIKISLTCLTSIVKKMNRTILDLAQSNSLGFEISVKLSERVNEYFIKLLKLLLINDHVASYFVFDLCGFEFLLDTIGVGSETDSNMRKLSDGMEIDLIDQIEKDVSKASLISQDIKMVSIESAFDHSNVFASLEGSDLAGYLEQNLSDFQQKKTGVADSIIKEVSHSAVYDKNNPQFVQEFSKSMAMVSNNGGDIDANYAKTDWSVNKRSYKHRVIIKHLTGKLRSEYWMIFQLPHEIELKEIQIAFNNYWAVDTEVYAEPLSVLVEAGMDQNNLSLVCSLQIVKDDAFGSVSATVFGQNLQTFQVPSSEFNINAIEDIITQNLQSIQNFKIKYIKICMRRHILTCLENSPLSTKFTKPPSFGINYISLLGYDLTKVGDYLTYIKQEQKKTALEVLSIICSGDFVSILKVIANQPQTIEKMKKSFTLLASLVSIKQNLIEPTFIAISTYNNEMGDWIINQFLKPGRNNKHAQLVGQIIMCNSEELPRRLSLLKDFVMSNLKQIVQEERSTHGTSIKRLVPFIRVFIHTLRASAQELEHNHSIKETDLIIKESYLLDIVQLLSSATNEREQQTKILTQLLVLLLSPPAPFINSKIDVFEFTVKHLLEEDMMISSTEKQVQLNQQYQRENLASILASVKSLIAEEIMKKGVNLDKLLQPGKNLEDQKSQNTQLQHCLKFWINVSQNSKVRQELAANKIPLKLYDLLRQDNPDQHNKIIKKDNLLGDLELSLFIELIKNLTAGSSKLEGELATSLMQDLEHLSRIRDMDFVNKVFLQLLRIERTVPICLWPYDSDNKKWIPNYKPITVSGDNSASYATASHNNFVPSSILLGEKRSVLIKNFKEIVSPHQKQGAKKLLNANWTLAHQQSEPGQVSQFQTFWKNIENKAPLIILIHGINASGNNVVFGCYSSKGVPAMPSNLAQDSDYPQPSCPEDFLFCYLDDNSFHHFAPKQGISLLSMFTDYEGGGAISVSNDFMLMSFSYDFVFTVGITFDLEKIQIDSNPKPEKEVESNSITLQKFEVWTCDTSKNVVVQAAAGAQSVTLPVTQQLKQIKGDNIESQVEMSLVQEIKHPWFNTLNPFINFRTNPVFMVPIHLTLQQLSKIMLQSNVFFKSKIHNNQVSQTSETIQDLYEQLQSNTSMFDKYNGILDLDYEVNQLVNSHIEDHKEEDIACEQDNSQSLSGYVPKMGLFAEFEDKGGVKLIISVTLQSMKLWKSEEQAKSWELWLKELESFSEIPLFFQLFLKNTKCKDLLFKVLAGLPDQELSAQKTDASVKAKWEDEQKAAVQFNYKILSEAFQISNDLKLRDIAMKSGLLPRILERLSAISGEKPRTYEDTPIALQEEEKKEVVQEPVQQMKQETNVDKKKRKGVGYSSKVGQTFNVVQYLENKKLRNDQIKNLIDIISNFINCKEWQASEEVLEIIYESALLPILENAFRNGSWLDMTKEYEVYHSYLGNFYSLKFAALARAIASQKTLIKALVEIDKNYKPSQTEPIYRLLQKLNDLADIFINCLNQQQKSEQIKVQPTLPNIEILLPINSQIPNDQQESLNLGISQLPSVLQSYIHQYQFPQSHISQHQLQEESKQEQDNEQSAFLNMLSSSMKNQIDSDEQIQHEELKNAPILTPGSKQFNSLSDAILSKISVKQPDNKKLTYFDIKNLSESASDKQSQDDELEPFPKESLLDDKIQAKIISQMNKSTEQPSDIEKMMTDFFTKDIEKNMKLPIKPKNPKTFYLVPAKLSESSSASEYETVSEHSLDSQGNSIKHSNHSSDWESDGESDVSDNKLKGKQGAKKTNQIGKKKVKIPQGVKKSPHFKSKPLKGKLKNYKPSKNQQYGSSSNGESSYDSYYDQKKKKHKSSSSEFDSYGEDSDASGSSSNPSGSYGDQSDNTSSYGEECVDDDEDAPKINSDSDDQEEYESEEDSLPSDGSEQDKDKNEDVKEHILIVCTLFHSFMKQMLNLCYRDSEIPENLARDVIKTYKIVQNAVSKILQGRNEDDYIENALHLPLEQCYKALLQDLRFDKMDMLDPADMTGTIFKHHYNSIAQQNLNPPSSKQVRLAQELADLSNALPYEHTNAIFVRVDQQRVDMMKALICGASSTPYAHGCYEFDIFCDNNYPREPPKMNLITTGNGGVRFNPNLYACGKVCLSLLGTWRGSATENWDPKLSTILQVVLSTQAIIMSEEVYFNEPGFENEAGTPEGEKKNEGYQNIVRYCNIKFAMLEQIKKPSKGFESVIKRHFFIKKPEILKEVHHWVELAKQNEATYGGLVNDHNYNWANQFKATKNKYQEMLEQVVQQLEDELNKLDRPTDYELKLQQDRQIRSKKVAKKKQAITDGKAELGEIDMDTDEEDNEITQINTESKKAMNIDDEAVKDRWSRYIGAMGVEAVAKQASASIFLSGAGALGIEISKNLVLSGCKTFTMHDYKPITMRDLSGQFFLNLEEDVLNEKKKKNTRGEACMPRLKQLNYYVKCKLAPPEPLPLKTDLLEQEPWNLHIQDVVVLTEATNEEIIFINEYCRKRGKKFIVADAYGVFSRVFNDFCDSFEVLDQNGEDLQDCMIKNISNEDEGLVELLPNAKHKFQDGDEVLFISVEGMKLLPNEAHEDLAFKECDSINNTMHKVKVLTPYSFKIGSTKMYEKYQRGGFAKQMKMKKIMKFSSFSDSMLKTSTELPLDANLSVADFEKMQNSTLSHIAFEALDSFRQSNKQLPGSWNKADAEAFLVFAKEISKRYDFNPEEWKEDGFELKFFYLFAFTCHGVFNPICAFQGGFIAQEVVKAVTQKFTPTQQVFYYDAIEVLPDFNPATSFLGDNNEESFFTEKYLKEIIKTQEINHRSDGLRILLGADLVDQLAHTRLFMVGAGAIGCELLKNYAMLGIGTGKANKAKKIQAGSIVLTDPDVIEVSNLNRQFLFREKHLRKPKSSTAAAAAIYMNRELKENIIARLDKVHEGTSHIFTDQFFETLTVVTNALDNVHARIYIDARCVTAKTPLLESGTLGPKGHVQVVLPYKTESYGSQADPEDNTEIPHCTLKMFPEETLHCVEWARDKFGKLFTQAPQNTIKILDEGQTFNPVSQQDTKSLKEGLKLLEKRPKTFGDCVEYARIKFEKFFNHDIKQLLHVYPLDAKTKDGNLFWSLPKRPPVPSDFDPTNPLHIQFITSMACLRANVFKIELPSKTPRTEEFRKEVGLLASQFKVPEFIPNDEKAKEIQASVQKEVKEEEKKEGEELKEEDAKVDANDVEILMQRFQALILSLPSENGKIISENLLHPEEFEKDNDANFHIDFIYATANCRSINYKLDPMDWITVKLKAGRIVPALSTTTSAVAGLQTLELVKLIKDSKKTDHRNIFLNLAVPFLQASEPADVLKTKLAENLEVTLWDRWEIKKGKNTKLLDVINHINHTYPDLQIRDVLKGSSPLYFYALMNAPGKEQEKEKTLHAKIAELVGAEADEKYVDISVTCIKTGDETETIISGVPPVRVHLE